MHKLAMHTVILVMHYCLHYMYCPDSTCVFSILNALSKCVAVIKHTLYT